MRRLNICNRLLLLLSLPCAALAQDSLPAPAEKLFEQARTEGRWFNQAVQLRPQIVATSGGRSFALVWRGSEHPSHWIASLHGAGRPARGFATDDLAQWGTNLQGRDVGIVCLQWWLGTGDSPRDFFTPSEIATEFAALLERLHVPPGAPMLHGFSRGAANLYAIAAIDRARERPLFSLFVASSGGMSPDYPPNQAISRGDYGAHPFKGTRWITVAGQQDPHPERDGIEGMRRTRTWLSQRGAEILFAIDDPESGHGALNRNPENLKRVLDAFLGGGQIVR